MGGGEKLGGYGKMIMSFGHFCSVATELSIKHLDIWVYCSEERWRLKRYLEMINIKMVDSTNSGWNYPKCLKRKESS